MSLLTFADVIESLTGINPPHAGQVINEAVIDPQKAIPNSLFIALPGQEAPQHFAEAFERGAALALTQADPGPGFRTLSLQSAATLPRGISTQDLPLCLKVDDTIAALLKISLFWRKRLAGIPAIAVTGSVGKTTTKDLVVEILEQRYRTLKNAGNLPNEIDIPLALTGLTGGHQRAVLELAIPGRTDFFAEMVAPRVVIVTNVGTAYTDETTSQAELASRMAQIVRALPPEGAAILNYDDPWVRDMAAQTQARVLFYGLSPQADLWADEVEGRGLEGIHFHLHVGSDALYLKVPLLGRHSVHTALRAAAVGLLEGFSWDEVARGLRFSHTQLRLMAVRSEQGALLLDDTYNASPESMLAALNLLHEMHGRKVAVLGGMPDPGLQPHPGHQLVGMRAAHVADLLITVGEPAQQIADAARMAWMPASAIVELADVEEAIAYLNTHLTAQDVVLIKGPRALLLDRIAAALEADA